MLFFSASVRMVVMFSVMVLSALWVPHLCQMLDPWVPPLLLTGFQEHFLVSYLQQIISFVIDSVCQLHRFLFGQVFL